MDEDRDLSLHTDHPGLERCTACARPFVFPVALLDFVDDGLFMLVLHCRNCDRLTTGVFEDAELERLEQANEAAVAEMEAALELVSVARFIDDLDGFTRALEDGMVLPEDF